jgi:hypothetical protein
VRVLLLAFVFFASAAAAQDYEREKRWASEIVPNLVVGDAVQLKLPSGREFLGLYAESKPARNAVLLADLGYATLSIQMPVQRSNAVADEYIPALFPEAAARIQAGAEWLAQKGYARPVLLSHSLGSWMSNVYFERTSYAPFAAWVCMGRSGAFGRMGGAQLPVLDVYGEQDLPNVLGARWRRHLTLDGIPGSKQVMIAAADHHYTGREKELAAEIKAFLATIK